MRQDTAQEAYRETQISTLDSQHRRRAGRPGGTVGRITKPGPQSGGPGEDGAARAKAPKEQHPAVAVGDGRVAQAGPSRGHVALQVHRQPLALHPARGPEPARQRHRPR